MPTQIQFRRDTASDWSSANPTLAAGEFGYESDTTKFKVGDGSTAWNSLAYNTSAGSGTTINNATANELVTVASTTTELDAEANLTFDGSTLTLTGSAALDGVTIADNEVSANRSNDNLLLTANGTGRVDIFGKLSDATLWGDWNGTDTRIKSFASSKEDLNVNADTVGREYGVGIHLGNKLTTGSSSNSNWRPRTLITHSAVDMNGKDYTKSGMTRGPNALNSVAMALNSDGSSASTLNSLRGASLGGVCANYDNPSQNLTLNTAIGCEAYVGVEGNGSAVVTIGTGYGVYSSAYTDKAGGAGTVTDFYAFYTDGAGATNHYAFYSDSDTSESRIGTLERYREKINSLTSSSTITVDCGLAPVHKVTLATNTGFNIANLGTGQSVTIIITQDGTGSRTASFGTDGSAAVKFAGGTPALSTAASAIDIVTIFNDGTNFYGNIAKAYA